MCVLEILSLFTLGLVGLSSLTVSLLMPCLQVLVLGNKRDLTTALDEKELIEKM